MSVGTRGGRTWSLDHEFGRKKNLLRLFDPRLFEQLYELLTL